MDPRFVFVFACGITIVASTIAGGYLPRMFRMTHVRMQLVLSFVGGMMLGVALLTLLPHGFVSVGKELAKQAQTEEEAVGISNGQSDDSVEDMMPYTVVIAAITHTVNSLMIGLLATFFMMRAFHFHQHGEDHDHGHSHVEDDSHSHGHSHDSGAPKTKLGWIGVALGLGLHTLIDGAALGTAVAQDPSLMGGFAVFLAILLHKPLDALSLSTLMTKEGYSWKVIQAANAAFGLMCLVGAIAALALGMQLGGFWMGCLLSAAAGVFLCISLSDLLPEVQFHRHDRLQLSSAMFCGIAVAFVMELFHKHA